MKLLLITEDDVMPKNLSVENENEISQDDLASVLNELVVIIRWNEALQRYEYAEVESETEEDEDTGEEGDTTYELAGWNPVP